MAAEILEGLDLFRKGELEDALNFLKVNLEKRVSKFGADHVSTAEAQSAIATILDWQGKHEEAMYYARETCKKLVLAYGFTNPNTLVALRIIANIILKQGRCDAALNVYQEVFHHQLKYSGILYHETLMTLNNLAFVLQKRGEDVLPIREKINSVLKDVRPNDLFTLQVQFDIAEQLLNRGRLDEALDILKEANAVYNRSRPRHLHYLISLDLTAKVLVKQGKHADALEIWHKVLNTEVESYGSYHPSSLETLILNILHRIAFTKAFQEKLTESLSAYEELYAKELQNNDEVHPSVLSIKNNVALSCQGKYSESLAMFQEVHKKRTAILGETHPDTLSSEKNIRRIMHLMS